MELNTAKSESVKYPDLLRKRENSLEMLQSKTLDSVLGNPEETGALQLEDGLVLLKPKDGVGVYLPTVYMVVDYFDTKSRGIFRACSFDHVGDSNIFLGAIVHHNTMWCAVTENLCSYDDKETGDGELPKLMWIQGATAFMAYHSDKYTGILFLSLL